MHRLICYELTKVWRKRSFLLSICVLLILNGFLLWYVNLPDEEEVPLSSYHSFQKQIEDMSEKEKEIYISNLKEKIDGICFVQEVLHMQNLQSEIGTILAEQAMTANPGRFEAYYELYQNGTYLDFTDSLLQEKALIEEIYAEWQKVANYNEYLESIQKKEDVLSGISIFHKQDEISFASRNIEKSAEDYAMLSDNNIHWMPSKALSISMESIWTDLFLILSVFLFVGNCIFEEREKRLFYIIRSTKRGHLQTILSKVIALCMHCVIMSCLLYGANLVFAEMTIGFHNLSASIQSVAAYMESNLSICIGEYILCSILTKSIMLFGTGVFLMVLCIVADHMFVPYLIGFLCYGISYILYIVLPAGEKTAILKYNNWIGLMKTEYLYGSYLNFNIGEYPISRLDVAWAGVTVFTMLGIFLSVVIFVYGNNFELKRRQHKYQKEFRPHASLLGYESYKIMIMNRALVILLLFSILIGYRIMSQEYYPSLQEQYYQNMMMELEGKLTEEKEALILSEQERYTQAFSEIDRIDHLVANGEVSESAGDSLKAKWYAITFFYPSFERVLEQYQRVSESGEDFIYDTGYLYVFGKMNNDYLIDLLLLYLCIVLAFSNVMVMEYQNGSWFLLCITEKGKKQIIFMKSFVCVIAVMMLSIIPIVCRCIDVSETYPLHGLNFKITDLPCYKDLPLSVPIWIFAILVLLSQMLSLIMVFFVVLLISHWRKNYIQTIFFAVLILVVPLILKLLGFSFAGWFTVYPIYTWY